jgi:hypothetical protein
VFDFGTRLTIKYAACVLLNRGYYWSQPLLQAEGNIYNAYSPGSALNFTFELQICEVRATMHGGGKCTPEHDWLTRFHAARSDEIPHNLHESKLRHQHHRPLWPHLRERIGRHRERIPG